MSSRACHQCFSIKQKCDRKSPCARCSRLRIDCTSVQRGQPDQAFRAAVVRRNRSGCDSCKKRKKKCDEARPKCSDCKRLNLPCVRRQSWQASSNDAQDPSNSAPILNTTTATTTIPETGSLSPAADLQAASDIDIEVDALVISTTGKPFYEWLSSDNGQMLAGSDQDPGVPTVLDRVPGSPTLQENDMPGLSNSGLSQPVLTLLTPKTISAPFGLTPQHLVQLSNRHDKHLFQHFTHIVSRSLSIASTDDDNPFLKCLIPLALTSNVVMGALLALSAIHLKHNGGYPEIVQRGLDLQTRALQSLNILISSGSSAGLFNEQALATILLFCIIDIREGNSSRWSWHITAAKTVITSAEQAFTYTPAWHFLLDVFEYVDSVITISLCKPPLIHHEKFPASSDDQDTSSVSSMSSSSQSGKPHFYNAVFGVARPLFRLIGEISALSSRRKDRMRPLFDEKYRKCAAEIDARLRAWEPPSLESPGENNFKEAIHAAIAIKWASILRLHQIVDGYALPHPIPTESLRQILDNLQNIRVGSAVETLMDFPLIMAGSVALSQEHRMTIRSRWLIIERTIGFGNISKGGKLLEQVWEAMNREINGDVGEPGKVNVNWASIRWYEYGSFVMF